MVSGLEDFILPIRRRAGEGIGKQKEIFKT
jgi:hypothetical protein